MDFYIDPAFCERILGYARTIARTRNHQVNEHGLQLAPILAQKRLAEIAELRQALLDGKDRLWLFSEMADIAYYSVCLDVVAPFPGEPYGWYMEALQMAHQYGMEQEEVEAALDAKYGLRAGLPYRKDRETPEERADRDKRENDAIECALENVVWTVLPIADVVAHYGIPAKTIYTAIKSGAITARQSGGERGTIIVRLDKTTRAWIARQRFAKFQRERRSEESGSES